MSDDPILEHICDTLRQTHGCHTAILYGSRARGEETATSDYDVLGIRSSGDTLRDARKWNGVYLDVFIYPESRIETPDASMLHYRRGRILFQREDIGERFLKKLCDIFESGPRRLPRDEITALRSWALKSLERIRAGGIEGDFRRAELLSALLEHVFTTQGLWFSGPRESFRWLKVHRPKLYEAFEAALKPCAEISSIEHLVAEYSKEPQAEKGL